MVNLYTDEVGNPELPAKLKQAQQDVLSKSTPQTRSIAVLPFNDLSPAEDQDYFGDGIAEEILTALAKVDGLRVAARRSSFWFKGKEADLSEIAEKLNVCHVLEGSVRREGKRVRVMAELIDACDGFTIWTETFERELQGIFAVQDEITRSIVDALKLQFDISAPPPSRSTEAYDAYLQGLFYSDKSTEEALRRSLEIFSARTGQRPAIQSRVDGNREGLAMAGGRLCATARSVSEGPRCGHSRFAAQRR